jgi:hypothetical protein
LKLYKYKLTSGANKENMPKTLLTPAVLAVVVVL